MPLWPACGSGRRVGFPLTRLSAVRSPSGCVSQWVKGKTVKSFDWSYRLEKKIFINTDNLPVYHLSVSGSVSVPVMTMRQTLETNQISFSCSCATWFPNLWWGHLRWGISIWTCVSSLFPGTSLPHCVITVRVIAPPPPTSSTTV